MSALELSNVFEAQKGWILRREIEIIEEDL